MNRITHYAHLLVFILFIPCLGWAQNTVQQRLDSANYALHRLPDDTNKIKALRGLTLSFLITEPDKAMEYVRQALALATAQKWEMGMATAYSLIGSCYMIKADYPNALENKLKGLVMRHDMQSAAMAKELGDIGDVYYWLDNYGKALEFYLKGLKIYRLGGNRKNEAVFLGNIGQIYDSQSDFVNALNYEFKSLKIFEDLNDYTGIAINTRRVGNIYYKQNDYAKALQYHQKALKLYEDKKDNDGIAYVLQDMALVYDNQKNYPEALKNYLRALKIKRELKDSRSVATIYLNLGALYSDMADYMNALDYNNKAYLLFGRLVDHDGVALSLGNIGTVYTGIATDSSGKKYPDSLGNKKALLLKAESKLLQALSIMNGVGDPGDMQEIYKNLSTAQALLGHYAGAFDSYKQYIKLRDSVYSDNNKKKIAGLESQRKADINEREIKIERLKVKRAREETVYIVSGILLLLLLGVVVYSRYQLKKRIITERKISELNLFALRSRMNPHFIFNSLNAMQAFIHNLEHSKAEGYIQKLSRLIRKVLEYSDKPAILLEDELELLGQYLELETMRFGNKFTYQMVVSPSLETDNILIPSMLIQPLIENAMLHAFMGISRKGQITISFDTKDGMLHCSIEDNGIGREQAAKMKPPQQEGKHKSIAIKDTQERLEIIGKASVQNARMAIIDLHDAEGHASGTRVELFLPLEENY